MAYYVQFYNKFPLILYERVHIIGIYSNHFVVGFRSFIMGLSTF
jgi:hypothetical protein